MSAPLQASREVILASCPLCGGGEATVVADGGPEGYEWVRCACDAVFKRRGPRGTAAGDMDTAADTGRDDFTSGHEDAAGSAHYDDAYFSRYARRRRRRVSKSRRQILDALEVAPPGRLLDVGCSLGYALEAARSLGLEASGADLSAHAVAECRRAGLDVHRGSLHVLPFEDASFAVVVLKHVFEHTPDPRGALAELRRVIIPGGAAFFAVPDVRYFKAVRNPATARFYRGEAARAHFVYYSPRTLARLLEEEGFRVASVHPRLVHRRGGLAVAALEMLALPFRLPARLIAESLGLRKEFWLVAVRT
ncbi:MAG: methyltransferase domain-containing protein [Candidatus Binatia bacterium]